MNTEIIKDLFLDAFWRVIYFPVWWYRDGLKKTIKFCSKQIKGAWRTLALSILLKNFFKPMYGQRGFEAYFLSFLVRLVQIFWRIFLMLFWLAFWLCVLVGWVVLPPLAIWKLIIG